MAARADFQTAVVRLNISAHHVFSARQTYIQGSVRHARMRALSVDIEAV